MDDQQEAFLSLSVYLTGFERVELLGTGMLEEYYKYFVSKTSDGDRDVLFTTVGNWPQQATSAEMDEHIKSLMGDETLAPIAKNVIRLWYTGAWRNVKDNPFSSEVASAQAYQEGLIWKVMHAHPPGAKQPGFGSWGDLPL